MQFESFAQVGEGFFLCLALACDIDFEALGDVPVSFTPNGRGEGAFHAPRIAESTVARFLDETFMWLMGRGLRARTREKFGFVLSGEIFHGAP